MFGSKVSTKTLLSTLLINEVKKRPPLYDYRSSMYRNKQLRRKLWDEVCRAVVPDFHELNNVDKYVKVKELQTRWKSLRDYYRATIIGKSKPTARKSKTPYMYAEDLGFLFPIICPNNLNPENAANNNSSISFFANHNDLTRDDDDEEMITAFEYSDENMSSGNSDNSNSSKIYRRINQQGHLNLEQLIASSDGAIEIIDDDPDWETPVVEIKKESTKKRHKRTSKFEKSLLKVIKNNFKESEIDGDKEFLLSLLPNIKKLSDYDKIELRTEFLNALKSKMKKDSES